MKLCASAEKQRAGLDRPSPEHTGGNGHQAYLARQNGQDHGVLLVAAEEERLGPGLVYEASRGGAMFPHLHGPMALGAVRWTAPLPLGADGIPQTGGLV